jgi:Flp pilus assembly pilin Flp
MNTKIQNKLANLARDQKGAGLVEYLLLVGLIAIICIAAFSEFGDTVSSKTGEFKGKVSELGN